MWYEQMPRGRALAVIAAVVGIVLVVAGLWWLWTWHLRPVEVDADRSVPGQLTLKITGPRRPGFYIVWAEAAPPAGSAARTKTGPPPSMQASSGDAVTSADLPPSTVVCLVPSANQASTRLTVTDVNERGPVSVATAPGKGSLAGYSHCHPEVDPSPRFRILDPESANVQ